MGKYTFAHGAKVWMFDAQNENCARRSCHCFFSDPIDATTAITAFLVGQPVGVCPVKRLSNGPPLDFGKIFLEYRQRFFGTIERLILLAAGSNGLRRRCSIATTALYTRSRCLSGSI